MNKNFYSVGQQFRHQGQIFTIKTITDNAVEISAVSGQSIWEKRSRFESNLGLDGKAGVFRWQNELLI